MSIDRMNYVPGQSETISAVSVGSPVLNEWTYFKLDGHFKFEMANVSLSQGGSPVPTAAYELAIDNTWTENEADYSGDTLYAMFRIIDDTYDAIETFVSGKNYGSMVDNEAVKEYARFWQQLSIGTGDFTDDEYTLDSGYTENVLLVTTGDTDRTVILPVTNGVRTKVLKIDSGTGKLTVEGVTGTINGGASLILPYQYSACELTGDATNLFILNTCNVWKPDTLWTGSETSGTHSLDSGKFSDYDLLIFYVQNSTAWITSATISTTVFVAGVPAMIPGTSQYLYYDYVSDTSFSIPDRSTVVAVRIEGVKL